MTENQSEDEYEYRQRVIDPMPEREFRMGEGKISGFISCFLGAFSVLAVLCYQLLPSCERPMTQSSYGWYCNTVCMHHSPSAY